MDKATNGNDQKSFTEQHTPEMVRGVVKKAQEVAGRILEQAGKEVEDAGLAVGEAGERLMEVGRKLKTDETSSSSENSK